MNAPGRPLVVKSMFGSVSAWHWPLFWLVLGLWANPVAASMSIRFDTPIEGQIAQNAAPLLVALSNPGPAPAVSYFLDGVPTASSSLPPGYPALLQTRNIGAGIHVLKAECHTSDGGYADASVRILIRGSGLPFASYEAEAGFLGGGASIATLSGMPADQSSSPALEASGRAFVSLDSQGAYLEWRQVRDCDAFVVRYSIPPGETATLGLYVNGVFRQNIALDGSRFGRTRSTIPGGWNFYDEARGVILAPAVAAGSTIRLQKDASSTAAYYWIDAIDLETRPPPLVQPANSLAVTDYGAVPNDAGDDTDAIQRCIDAAKKAGKSVWIPAGDFLRVVDPNGVPKGARLTVDSVAIQGAGWWYTQLRSQIPLGVATGGGTDTRFDITISGTAPAIKDLYIVTNEAYRDKGDTNLGGHEFGITGSATNFVIENVWLHRTGGAIWVGGAGGVVRGCRISAPFADGIHIAPGGTGIRVEHNFVRGAGDDSLAVIDEMSAPLVGGNITLVRNTAEANYWGHPLDISGGYNLLAEKNVFADSGNMAAIAINHTPQYPCRALNGAVIRENTILRGGGNHQLQQRGAFWVYAGCASVNGVQFSDNQILGSLFSAMDIPSAGTGLAADVTISGNTIDQAGTTGGTNALRIHGGAAGSVKVESNILLNQSAGYPSISSAKVVEAAPNLLLNPSPTAPVFNPVTFILVMGNGNSGF